MRIVPEVFKKVELLGAPQKARMVLVTKYLDKKETEEVLAEARNFSTFWALGENRIDQILEKNLPKESVHFIGNIQSRRISEIAQRCAVVHSLDSISHARKLCACPEIPAVFIQINISRELQKGGILPEELPEFLKQISPLPLEILGLSAMGEGEFDEVQKRAEFRELISLRDRLLPGKKISAGTSRDFEIALEEGIDTVRVGTAALMNFSI